MFYIYQLYNKLTTLSEYRGGSADVNQLFGYWYHKWISKGNLYRGNESARHFALVGVILVDMTYWAIAIACFHRIVGLYVCLDIRINAYSRLFPDILTTLNSKILTMHSFINANTIHLSMHYAFHFVLINIKTFQSKYSLIILV